MRGRPTKLTDNVVDVLCAALRAGGSWAQAAKAAGVSESVVHDWRRRGEAEDAEPLFYDFFIRVGAAEAQRYLLYSAEMRQSARALSGSVIASMRVLERLFLESDMRELDREVGEAADATPSALKTFAVERGMSGTTLRI